jgi:hypothetical protein
MCQHSRPVEAQMVSHYIHTCGIVVDDFSIKYVGKEHANHLLECIRTKYKLLVRQSVLWYKTKMGLQRMHTQHLHAGIRPEAAPKVQTHHLPCPQHCPYSPEPKKYGLDAQSPLSLDTTCKLSNAKISQVQKIVGSILCYARAVDMMVLMALSTIASEHTTGTKCTMETASQLLDCLASHRNATIHFRASNMIMNIHSNMSYLTEPKSRSRACRHFFFGW